jgi:hypothetical protein
MTIRAASMPLLLLLEVMWGWSAIAIAARMFSGGNGPGPSLLAPAIAVLGSAALVSVLSRFELELNATRILGVAATLAALAIIIPLEYGTTLDIGGERGAALGASLAILAIWIRGILRAREGRTVEAVGRSALLGLIPVAIAAAAQPDVNGPDLFGELAIAYVPLALLVLAIHQAGEPQRPVTALTSQWGPMAAVALVAGTALAVAAAAIDPGSFRFLGPAAEPLRAAGDLVGRYVLGPIFGALASLLRLLPGFPLPDQEFRPNEQPERPPPEEKDDNGWGIPFAYLLNELIVGVIVLFALLALALLFYRLRRNDGDEDEAGEVEHEGNLRDDLADMFGAFRQRFRRQSSERDSAYAIRRLYAEMLDAAADAGLERPPAVTPSQFASALEQLYGNHLPAEITAAFIASRYGQQDITTDRVAELEVRWRTRPANT